MGNGAQQAVASACGGPVSFGQFLDHPSFSYLWDHIPGFVAMAVSGIAYVFVKKVSQDVMDRPIKATVKQITRFIGFLGRVFGLKKKVRQPSQSPSTKPINPFLALFHTYLVIMICTIFIKDVNISASNLAYSAMFAPLNAFMMKALQSRFYARLFRGRSFLNDFFYADICLLVSFVVVGLLLLFVFPFIYVLDPVHTWIWKIL